MSLFFKFVTQRLRAVATLVCVCGGGGGGGGGGKQNDKCGGVFKVLPGE